MPLNKVERLLIDAHIAVPRHPFEFLSSEDDQGLLGVVLSRRVICIIYTDTGNLRRATQAVRLSPEVDKESDKHCKRDRLWPPPPDQICEGEHNQPREPLGELLLRHFFPQ